MPEPAGIFMRDDRLAVFTHDKRAARARIIEHGIAEITVPRGVGDPICSWTVRTMAGHIHFGECFIEMHGIEGEI